MSLFELLCERDAGGTKKKTVLVSRDLIPIVHVNEPFKRFGSFVNATSSIRSVFGSDSQLHLWSDAELNPSSFKAI